jgi:hypothetical protein
MSLPSRTPGVLEIEQPVEIERAYSHEITAQHADYVGDQLGSGGLGYAITRGA